MTGRRGSPALAALLLTLGCPSGAPPDEPLVLLDDDDDSAWLPDDDDSAVEPPLRLQAWIVDQEILGLEPAPVGESHAAASALLAPVGLGAWRLADNAPVPGLGLHPDRADLLEACEALDASSPDGLPAGADLGSELRLSPSSGDTLTLPWVDGRYLLDAGPPISGAPSWTLSAGSPDPALAFSAPTRPAGVQPGPGTFSLGSTQQVTWTPADGPVEILLLRFDSPINTSDWEAVRCVAEDDGVFSIDPTSLAGPNTGSLVFTVSRASWSADGTDVFVRSTAALADP